MEYTPAKVIVDLDEYQELLRLKEERARNSKEELECWGELAELAIQRGAAYTHSARTGLFELDSPHYRFFVRTTASCDIMENRPESKYLVQAQRKKL